MRKVAFVGLNTKSKEAIKSIPEDVEIWTMNDAHDKEQAPTLTRIDLLFDIHNLKLMQDKKWQGTASGKYERHMEFLKTNTEIPVLMQESYYPASVKYPYDAALAITKGKKRFSSSFDWMAAYAIIQEVEKVIIYGFEMDYHSTEYRHQKPSALYWIGRMEGAGIEVESDPSCSLFQEKKLYGFGKAQMIPRQTLDVQVDVYKKQMEGHLKNLYMWQAVLKERQSTKRGNVAEAAKHAKNYEINAASCEAVIKVLNHLIDECDLSEDI